MNWFTIIALPIFFRICRFRCSCWRKRIKHLGYACHIVGDRKDFNYEKVAAYGSPIAGYANTNNEIGILGKRVGDKIIINQNILGHELNHLLNFRNPKIVNPDKLDEMGL